MLERELFVERHIKNLKTHNKWLQLIQKARQFYKEAPNIKLLFLHRILLGWAFVVLLSIQFCYCVRFRTQLHSRNIFLSLVLWILSQINLILVLIFKKIIFIFRVFLLVTSLVWIQPGHYAEILAWSSSSLLLLFI